MQTTQTAIRPAAGPDNAPRTAAANWVSVGSVCVILLLCIVVGATTIRADNYFLGDDFGLVHHLHDLSLRRFATYFFSDWTEGIYGEPYDELRSRQWANLHAGGPMARTHYRLACCLFGLATSSTQRMLDVEAGNGAFMGVALSPAPRL